jgi:hypothetical protein
MSENHCGQSKCLRFRRFEGDCDGCPELDEHCRQVREQQEQRVGFKQKPIEPFSTQQTFDVTVTRTSWQKKTFRVTAKDELDAEDQVSDMSQEDEGDWETGCDDEYETEKVVT